MKLRFRRAVLTTGHSRLVLFFPIFLCFLGNLSSAAREKEEEKEKERKEINIFSILMQPLRNFAYFVLNASLFKGIIGNCRKLPGDVEI